MTRGRTLQARKALAVKMTEEELNEVKELQCLAWRVKMCRVIKMEVG